MLNEKESFSDLPRPSFEGSIPKGKRLRTFYMDKVTSLLGNIIDKRQMKFNDFVIKCHSLQERVPAVYIEAEEIEKMSQKYNQFNLSDEDFAQLIEHVQKYAKIKVENTGYLGNELYFKYTRLFYYSFILKIKHSLGIL
jgi:hypothetical protein